MDRIAVDLSYMLQLSKNCVLRVKVTLSDNLAMHNFTWILFYKKLKIFQISDKKCQWHNIEANELWTPVTFYMQDLAQKTKDILHPYISWPLELCKKHIQLFSIFYYASNHMPITFVKRVAIKGHIDLSTRPSALHSYAIL
jgi:hypothetical protein